MIYIEWCKYGGFKLTVDFNKLDKKSVSKIIIDQITEAIIKRQYRPGDKLPTEFELCEMFGVGRNSVREAIKILESYGVVEIRRAEGTFIRSGFSEQLIQPLLYSIILAQDDSLQSLKEFRQLIDVGVTEMVIDKADEKGLKKLKFAYDNMKNKVTTRDIEAIVVADNMFHDVMFEIADNSLIRELGLMTRRLTGGMIRTTVANILRLGEVDNWLKAHEDIVGLVERKDYLGINKVTKESYFYDKNVLDE